MKNVCLLFALIGSFSFAENAPDRNIQRLEKYCQKNQETWEGNYNLAREYYFNDDFSNAQKHFEIALTKCPQEKQEPVFYNLGNTYFQQAQVAENQQKIPLLEKSVQNYESALAWNQEAKDTKNNLEIAKKQLEQLQKNQQNNNQNQQNNQQGNNDNHSQQQNNNSKDKPNNNDADSQSHQNNAPNSSQNTSVNSSQHDKKKQEMKNILQKVKNDEKILPTYLSTENTSLPKDEILKDW